MTFVIPVLWLRTIKTRAKSTSERMRGRERGRKRTRARGRERYAKATHAYQKSFFLVRNLKQQQGHFADTESI